MINQTTCNISDNYSLHFFCNFFYIFSLEKFTLKWFQNNPIFSISCLDYFYTFQSFQMQLTAK